MVPGLSDEQFFLGDPVHETMFLSDASGPNAWTEMTKGLGLAEPVTGVAANSFDQFQNFEGGLHH